tara:strand:- start:312 stop:470 length:159 start_codon:yes stop_codon:yes gene_type:complete
MLRKITRYGAKKLLPEIGVVLDLVSTLELNPLRSPPHRNLRLEDDEVKGLQN